jgi:hypothetical protein
MAYAHLSAFLHGFRQPNQTSPFQKMVGGMLQKGLFFEHLVLWKQPLARVQRISA